MRSLFNWGGARRAQVCNAVSLLSCPNAIILNQSFQAKKTILRPNKGQTVVVYAVITMGWLGPPALILATEHKLANPSLGQGLGQGLSGQLEIP
ncbi:MAG: hypothetical protein KAU41_00945 [Deltaproteobacteria bacterium]|nr:hypothetical protein [Deltaproteobacteria bacterium]